MLLELYAAVVRSGDDRSRGWFLVDSPLYPLLTIIAYLLVATRVGPFFMHHRAAFTLRTALLFYNAFQVFCCVWYIYEMGSLPLKENYFCMTLLTGDAQRNRRHPVLGWSYMLMKYLDLIDTLFFVLKKKRSHITFLHVFHHASMVLFSWGAVKFHPGGMLALTPLLNVWVHLFMYTYYFAMAYMGSVPLYWKKKMTQLQIMQFALFTAAYSIHLFNPWCEVSKVLCLAISMQASFFLYLFVDFYYSAYRRTA